MHTQYNMKMEFKFLFVTDQGLVLLPFLLRLFSLNGPHYSLIYALPYSVSHHLAGLFAFI
jgi:hypothetical protein